MFSKLKQLQNLRKQAQDLKNNLAQEIVSGEAIGGQIKISMDGNQEVKEVFIDESLLSSENKEMLEKGIKEALSKVLKEVQTLMARKIQSGDLQIPNL
jgi:hypothetical protein